MIKPSKKWFAVLASAGIFACAAGTFSTNANDIIYNDSNISITSAVDRYIEANEDAFADDEPATASEVESTETDAKNAAVATGSITEVAASVVKYPEFEGKALVVIADSVNIRAEADMNSERVGGIGAGGIMTVVDRGDEWSLITSGNCEGYIKNEFIAFGDDAGEFAEANLSRVAVVNASTLRLRAGESEDSECLTLLSNGEKYHILSYGDEWTQVEVDDTLSGYVKNEYIDITYDTVTAVTAAEEEAYNSKNNAQEESDYSDAENNDTENSTTETTTTEQVPSDVPVSGTGVEVANYALQFVGNPYVYGGTSLTNGADCSGFVMKVYEHFGYSIPRTADVQATVGAEVNLSALAPGDLVFYDHGSGSIQHVAMYIGNGQVVHASSSTTGIIVSNTYYSTPCKAVRIIY